VPACHVAAASHVPGKCKRADAEKERRQPVALVVVTVTRMQRRLVAGEPGRQRVCGQRPVGDRERDERNSYGERNSHDGRSKGRHARSLRSEESPANYPAGATAVTAAAGERGMPPCQTAEAPPEPSPARRLSPHGVSLDERKWWPQ
jgi:hypothetical protein